MNSSDASERFRRMMEWCADEVDGLTPEEALAEFESDPKIQAIAVQAAANLDQIPTKLQTIALEPLTRKGDLVGKEWWMTKKEDMSPSALKKEEYQKIQGRFVTEITKNFSSPPSTLYQIIVTSTFFAAIWPAPLMALRLFHHVLAYQLSVLSVTYAAGLVALSIGVAIVIHSNVFYLLENVSTGLARGAAVIISSLSCSAVMIFLTMQTPQF